jgi:glycosyltransferase involved in cell wall biosynthesis
VSAEGATDPFSTVKILFVDTETVWRGGQEQLLGLMLGMQRLGIRIALATPAGSPLGQRSRDEGIEVVDFAQHFELSISAFFRFLGLIRRTGCKILHFNTPKPILIGCLAGRMAGVRVTVASRRVNFPLKSRISVLKYNLLLDRVFTVSASIRATLVKLGVHPELVEVIYEGVDLAGVDTLQTDYRLPVLQGPIIGTVAHLSMEKGHVTLLRAARMLKEQKLDFSLVIVGGGELRKMLEELVGELGLSSQVMFTGFRPDSDALMKQFDIFCLPSLSEGLSSAILAAMACGLPVVSTSVGGIPELVLNGETGYLVEPEDPESLAQALEALLCDLEVRHEFGEAGRRRIESQFTQRQKLQATRDAYLRLLRDRGVG